MHPITHTGLARERQRDLERAMRTRRLTALARADAPETFDGLRARQVSAVATAGTAPYTLKRICITSPSCTT